jgi:hypothetical protein
MENWMRRLYNRIVSALLRGWQLVGKVPSPKQRSKSRHKKYREFHVPLYFEFCLI